MIEDRMPMPPDLQELVESYGGYWKIPQDEWLRYDRMCEQMWLWCQVHHRVLPPDKK